jgi:hypothetical protein
MVRMALYLQGFAASRTQDIFIVLVLREVVLNAKTSKRVWGGHPFLTALAPIGRFRTDRTQLLLEGCIWR